ncbi:MAG: MBL fold metallo-hydrolase [Rikenellaceae bacterium]
MAKKNELLGAVRKNWAGNRVVDGKFVNIDRKPSAFKSITKWSRPFRKERSVINYGKKWEPETIMLDNLDSLERNSLIWLGHNSFIINLAGVNIILDPIFGGVPFVIRKSRLPIDKNKIQPVDLLLLSHDHFDHADKSSVKTLIDNNNHIEVLAGLGIGKLVRSWSRFVKINEMGWYQQYEYKGVKITFLPCQHWGKRSIMDGAKRLWGAFMIEGDGIKIYYSGDSSYAKHFKEIKQLFGGVDYALVGIGAYKPRWFLERNHLSPNEALDAAEDMGAAVTIPMHYGTFKLSEEPLFDPPIVFKSEALRRGMKFEIPSLGGVVKLNKGNF